MAKSKLKKMTKICTSIEQSQKLIELGIDINTADMRYGYIAPYDYSDRMFDDGYDEVPYPKDFLKKNPNFSENHYDGEFPAWSLAALFSILPEINGIPLKVEKVKAEDGYDGYYYHIEYEGIVLIPYSKNPVDACYEIILKLHELNLL